MNTRYQKLSVAALALILLVGCESSPEKQIEEAYAALTTADSLEADQYVTDLYLAAQDSFALAQAEIEAQEGVAGTKPDYTHARELLAFVTRAANQASAEVPTRKETMRIETDSLIANAQTRLAAAQELIAATPARDKSVAVVSLQTNSQTAQSALQHAVEAQAAGEFAVANELVKQAIGALEALEAQTLQEGVEATTPRS